MTKRCGSDKAPSVAAVALLIAVASGCGARTSDTLSPPPAPPPVGAYTLKAGDTVAARYPRNPELNEDLVVRPDGYLSLPLVDDVVAAGRTPAEVAAELRGRYVSILAHPDVRLIVKTFAEQRVTVAGEVEEPGVQPLVAGLTLSEAIHRAGGFLKSANRAQVILIRREPSGTRGYAIDLRPVESGEHPEIDVALQSLDQIYVPRSPIANVNLFVEKYIRNNIPVNSLGIGITPF